MANVLIPQAVPNGSRRPKRNRRLCDPMHTSWQGWGKEKDDDANFKMPRHTHSVHNEKRTYHTFPRTQRVNVYAIDVCHDFSAAPETKRSRREYRGVQWVILASFASWGSPHIPVPFLTWNQLKSSQGRLLKDFVQTFLTHWVPKLRGISKS
jgi:hypothetical protein